MKNLFELLVPKSIKKAVKRIAVCLIDRNKIMFVSFPDKVVKEFNFPQALVSDADVINKEEYRLGIYEWVKDNFPKTSEIIFLVSEHMAFTKDFRSIGKTRSPSQETLNSFIEVVPFQRVYISKITTKDGLVKMVVTNRDVVSPVIKAFESYGFDSLGVFPEFSIISDSAEKITPQNFQDQARKHADIYTLHPYIESAFNATLQPQQKPITQMSVSEAAKQPVNPILAVAIVLAVVGGAVYFIYWRFEQIRVAEIEATRKRIELLAAKQIEPQKTNTQIIPVAADKSQTATESGTVRKKIKVQIVYAASSARLYELVRSSLVATYDYEVSGEQSSQTPQENKIISSEKVSETTVLNIRTVLNSANLNIDLSSKANIDEFDVVVTLGKVDPAVSTQAPQQN